MVQPTLPTELIAEVLSYIPPSRTDEASDRVNQRTLAVCCRVSAQFLPLARAQLYHSPTFHGRGQKGRTGAIASADGLDDSSRKLCHTIYADSSLADLVHHASVIGVASAAAADLLDNLRRTCRNVRSIRIDSGYCWDSEKSDEALARFGAGLKRLEFGAGRDWSDVSCQVLRDLEGLTSLIIKDGTIPMENSTDFVGVPPSFHLQQLTFLAGASRCLTEHVLHNSGASLRILAIPGVDEEDETPWDLSEFTALRSLTLRLPGGNWDTLDNDEVTCVPVLSTILSAKAITTLVLCTLPPWQGVNKLHFVGQAEDFLLLLPSTLITLEAGMIQCSDKQVLSLARDRTSLPALRYLELSSSTDPEYPRKSVYLSDRIPVKRAGETIREVEELWMGRGVALRWIK